MNNVQLIGNLTRDPELRHTNNQRTVCQLRLAISRPRRDGNDQGAEFVDVTAWDAQAENCAKYLAKGRKVAVEGRLHHSEWDSNNGHRQHLEVYANRIEFLSPRPDDNNTNPPADPVPAAVGAEDAEDIPF